MSTIQISSGVKRSDRTSAPIALAALLAVGMAAVVTAAPAELPGETKPNILFIMGDDIGWMQPSIYHRGWMVGRNAQYRPHRQ